MLSVKKATKFAVANLIIVSTVFSSITPAIANPIKVLKMKVSRLVILKILKMLSF